MTSAKEGECPKHHWHSPTHPFRGGGPRGWFQARCCICQVRAWMRPKTPRRCTGQGLAILPKAAEVQLHRDWVAKGGPA